MESLKSLISANKSGDEVQARHERCEQMRETSLEKCALRSRCAPVAQ